MKKYLFLFGFILGSFFLVSHTNSAFAANCDFTVTPSSTVSGSEGAMTINLNSDVSTYAVLYLFDPSGNSVGDADGGSTFSSFPQSVGWTGVTNFGTNLAAGNWTVVCANAGGSTDYNAFNPTCGAGTNLTTCNPAGANWGIEDVTITSSMPSSSLPLSIYDTTCTTDGSTTICDIPLETKTGEFISFLEITVMVSFGYWFFMHHGHKKLS